MTSLPIQIKGSNFVLINPRPADSDAFIVSLYNNYDALKDLAFMAKRNLGGWTLEDATKRRAFFEKMNQDCAGLNFVIKMDDGNYAGVAGFRDLHWWNRSAEMGIILHPNYWGKGLATEIHLICYEWAFEVAKLHRVELKTSISNSGMNYLSKEVMKMNLDGTIRDYFPSVDCSNFRADAEESSNPTGVSLQTITYESVNIWSLLETEWPICKASLLAQVERNERKG